ncbi:MAG TPA: trypsin-like peptidase domain-containing protein [Tepidisphaeraceae bacterium]|nr:trypsin-like peptidase domain-containing protein [Tepidisphaeraceae bacterium]
MQSWRHRFGVALLSGAAIAAGFFGGAAMLNHVEFARAESDVAAGRQALSQIEDLSSVFREVAKVVAPSVVKIEITKTVHIHSDMDEDLLRKFFHDNGQDAPDQEPDQEFEQDGTGSGVIMETGNGYGYILTNNHVAGDADDIKVTLNDGRIIEHGRLMGADPKSDLAVVRIKADNLIAAKWGNSDDLQTGDWVLAFGAPLGFAGTMTHGIVSALNRNDVALDEQEQYENFIQVDAPINPGNSGGPLVNVHGEVVGINTAIASRTGTFDGIGFAIPSNQAYKLYATLKAGNKVVRGWLGVEIKSVADELKAARSFGYTGNTGVLIEDVMPGTPAEGKLIAGDIVTAYDGHPVANADELRNAVAQTAPGSHVTLRVFRNNQMTDVVLTIGRQPDDLTSVLPGHGDEQPAPNPEKQEQAQADTLGMHLRSLTPDLARQLGLDDNASGAVIADVKSGSVAASAGLRPGIVITHVGRTQVNSAREAYAALADADLKQGVRLTILTQEGSGFVVLQEDDSGPSDN